MSDDLIISAGEFLGILPFTTSAGVENVATHMVGGNLIRLDPASTEVLAFCRSARTGAELDEWIDATPGVDAAAVQKLVDERMLRRGPAASASSWLADAVLVPAGHSAGLVDGAMTLVSAAGAPYRVDSAYYWLWLYARTGRTLDDVRRFLADQGQVSHLTDEVVSASVLHMLLHGLGRIDSTS